MRGTLVGFGGRFRFPSACPVFLSKGEKVPKDISNAARLSADLNHGRLLQALLLHTAAVVLVVCEQSPSSGSCCVLNVQSRQLDLGF